MKKVQSAMWMFLACVAATSLVGCKHGEDKKTEEAKKTEESHKVEDVKVTHADAPKEEAAS